MSPPLPTLLARLGEEVGRCANEARRLENVMGPLVARSAPTRREIEAVQALDGLTQHLRAVAAILGAAAEDHAGARLDLVIRRTGLEDLSHRLLHGMAVSEPAAGEPELW